MDTTTTSNFTTIRIDEGQEQIYITSLYEEPGGPNCPRLGEMTRRLTNRQTRHLLAGDLNAHNAAWGEDVTDARGVEVLAWANAMGFHIWNEREQGPTFLTVRGESYIDLTMSKGVNITGWTVEEEESLSGHRHIQFRAEMREKREEKLTRQYDFENTNWDAFKTELKRLTDETITQDMDIEQKADRLQEACRKVCQRKIARKNRTDGRDNDWFDDELGRLRTDTRRARRNWQWDKTDENRRTYVETRNTYKKKIKEKKIEYMTELIDEKVDQEPWFRVWNFIGKRKSYEPKKNYLKDNGQYTQTDDETNEYLIRKYFPEDRPDDDNDERRIIRGENVNYRDGDEASICLEEVLQVAKTLKKRKATPRSDRVPNEVVTRILEAIGELVASVYRQCWEERVFPRVWKKAEIIWIPKKDGSPRPISLLPTLGKVLDRIANKRLQQHLERKKKLSQTQYAYRQGRGTIDALKNLMSILEANRREKKHQVVVALDQRNAFNSAWKPYIRRQLREAEVDINLAKLCESFLDDRMIRSGEIEMPMMKGCPQGSSLGPTLWNLVMEGWFQALERANEDWRRRTAEEKGVPIEYVGKLAEHQAYADDQVVVIAGSSVREIERKWSSVWEACCRWSNRSNTAYNTAKTEILFITKDGKRVRPPVIDVGGIRVEMGDSIKYLGVTVDRALNFNEHLSKVREKVMRVSNKLVSVTRKSYGNSQECIKAIVERVAKPAVMYAVEIWGNKAAQAANKKVLAAAQRPFLLAVVRAYRTTATAALSVLAGLPPWWIEASVGYAEHRRNLAEIQKGKLDTIGLPGIAKILSILRASWVARENACIINVDASGGPITGIGIVGTSEGRTDIRKYRIQEKINVGLAETIAVILGLRTYEDAQTDVTIRTDRLTLVKKIYEGKPTNNYEVELVKALYNRWKVGLQTKIEWVRRNEDGQVLANEAAREAKIRVATNLDLSDWSFKSRKRRREERMERVVRDWQENWDNDIKGRELYRHCRQVGLDIIKTTFKATQMMTGHGNTKAYIRRFNLKQTDGICDCGLEDETQEHIMTRCTRQTRQNARDNIRTRYGDLSIQLRDNGLVNMEQLNKVNLWAEQAMDVEDFDRREGRDSGGEDNDEMDDN